MGLKEMVDEEEENEKELLWSAVKAGSSTQNIFPFARQETTTSYVFITLFLCAFWSIASKTSNEMENFETKKSYFAKNFLCILM